MSKRAAIVCLNFVLAAALPCAAALLFFEAIPSVPKLYLKFHNTPVKRALYDLVLPFLIYASFPPTWIQFCLTERRARIFPLHAGTIRFAFPLAKLTLIAGFFVLPFALFSAQIERVLGRDGATAAVVAVLLFVLWLYVRISPIFPAALDRACGNDKYGLKQAWRQTAGQNLRLLGLHIGVMIAVWSFIILLAYISNIIGPNAPTALFRVFQHTLVFVQLALFAAIAVRTYNSGRTG